MRSLCILLTATCLSGQPGGGGRPRTPQTTATATPQPELKPEDYGLISGQVTSATDGSPLRKATVTLRRSDGDRRQSGPPQTASTGDGGVFLFNKVAPGRYRIHLERNGFVGQDYGARRARATGQEVRVENGQRVTGLQAKLQAHGVVSGVVRDEDGDAMPTVRVQVFRWGHVQGRRQLMPMDSAMSDDRGQYRIYGVAPGKYVITAVTTRSYRGDGDVVPPPPEATGNDEAYAPVFYPGSNDASQATAMDVAPGASLEGINFTMRRVRTVRVSGRVLRTAAATSERSRPVTVILLAKSSGMLGTMNAPRAMTDGQGRFEIRAVRPGAYTLHAEEMDRQTRLTADASLDVGPAGLENITLPLTPGVEVSGSIVVEEAKEPTPRIGIWIRSRQGGTPGPFGGGLNTNAKDDGTFTVRSVSPGEYEVRVSGLPDGYYLKSIRAGDQEALHSGFTVGVGGAPVLTIVASPNAGTVEGSVLNAEQKPVAGSTVVLWPTVKGARSALFKSVTSDAQGHFSLSSVAPGDYRLAAFEFLETGAAQDPDFLQSFESKADKLNIREKARETKALTEMIEP